MHRVLERQIKRFLGEVDPKTAPPGLMALLQAVGDTYIHADEDRELTLRSLELTSREFAAVNRKLSEALEAFRRGNPNNIKVAPVGGESEPVFSEAELELADVVIRLACYCSRKGFRMARAVIAKLRYNEGRPVRHGGKLF